MRIISYPFNLFFILPVAIPLIIAMPTTHAQHTNGEMNLDTFFTYHIVNTEQNNTMLFIGNKQFKYNAPIVLPLLMHDYKIKVRKSDLLDGVDNVSFKEKEEKPFKLTMLSYEDSNLAIKDCWERARLISGVGGLVAGCSAVYFKMQVYINYDKYRAAVTSEDAVRFREKTQSNERLFRIAIVTASGLLTIALLSWIMQ